MLIDVKQQKNGTLLITAPDQTAYAFNLDIGDKDQATKVCEQMGKTILEILNDKDQPEMTSAPAGHHAASNGSSGIEDRARAVHPAVGAFLDFFQDLSKHDEAG